MNNLKCMMFICTCCYGNPSICTLVNMCCTVFYISRVVVGGSPFSFTLLQHGPTQSHPNKHNIHISLPLSRLMRVACETKFKPKLNSHKRDLHFEDKNNLSRSCVQPVLACQASLNLKSVRQHRLGGSTPIYAYHQSCCSPGHPLLCSHTC